MPGPGKGKATAKTTILPAEQFADSDGEDDPTQLPRPREDLGWVQAFQLLSDKIDRLTGGTPSPPVLTATSMVKTPSKQTAGPSGSGHSLPARRDLLPQLQAQDNEGGSIDELSVFIQANFACQHFKERDRNELLLLLEIGKQADALREGTRERLLDRLRLFAGVAAYGWAAALRANQRRQVQVLGLQFEASDIERRPPRRSYETGIGADEASEGAEEDLEDLRLSGLSDLSLSDDMDGWDLDDVMRMPPPPFRPPPLPDQSEDED